MSCLKPVFVCVCVSPLGHTGVVLCADPWKLPWGCDHRPPQSVEVPRHWHSLQLSGLFQALQLSSQLPHEPQAEMWALVKCPRWAPWCPLDWHSCVKVAYGDKLSFRCARRRQSWLTGGWTSLCLLSSYFSVAESQVAESGLLKQDECRSRPSFPLLMAKKIHSSVFDLFFNLWGEHWKSEMCFAPWSRQRNALITLETK